MKIELALAISVASVTASDLAGRESNHPSEAWNCKPGCESGYECRASAGCDAGGSWTSIMAQSKCNMDICGCGSTENEVWAMMSTLESSLGREGVLAMSDMRCAAVSADSIAAVTEALCSGTDANGRVWRDYCAGQRGMGCVNGGGLATCACMSGWTQAKDSNNLAICEQDDPCAASPCHAQARCDNDNGNAVCSCNTGYTGSGTSCTDINECNGSHGCHADATCQNNLGGHTCTCKTGYTGSGTSCTDINECNGSHGCHADATCQNTVGGHTCTCKTGYTGSGTSCTDINECNGSHGCHADATCQNTVGGHTCTCKTGYTGSGTSCTDINECNGSHGCHADATCQNNVGGHTCTCKTGYTGSGTSCTDINECNGSNDCHADATCQNNNGGHTCACKGGYTGNGTHCSLADFVATCNPDGTMTVDIPYTRSAQMTRLEYGDCDLNSDGVTVTAQDSSTFLLSVVLNPGKCQASTLQDKLIYNETARINVGKLDTDGTEFKFSEFNVDVECGWINEYTVTFDYGTLTTDDFKFTDGMGPTASGISFNMSAYSSDWSTHLSTPPSQAGKTIRLGLKFDARHNLGSHFQFALKSCSVTDGSSTYTLFDTSVSCDNSNIDLSLSYVNNMWRIQHILFLIGSDNTSTYTLTCQVVVCDSNMPASDNKCTAILSSCG